MDTNLLKTFSVLSRIKNFTKAAQVLHLSQSAISLQIAKLEEFLGKTLFIRNNRNVDLSLDGEKLLGYVQQILDIEQNLLAHFQDPHPKGDVKFGTPEDLATAYLPDVLANFTKIYPAILLNVACEFTLNLIQGFDSDIYDIALIKQDPKKPHPKSEEVWKECLAWVSTPNIRLQSKKIPVPLILAPSPCVYRQRAIDTLNNHGIPWKIVYTSPSITGTLAGVQAGLGVSILPAKMIPKNLRIVEELPDLKDTQIAILKKETASEAAKTFGLYLINNIISKMR